MHVRVVVYMQPVCEQGLNHFEMLGSDIRPSTNDRGGIQEGHVC